MYFNSQNKKKNNITHTIYKERKRVRMNDNAAMVKY